MSVLKQIQKKIKKIGIKIYYPYFQFMDYQIEYIIIKIKKFVLFIIKVIIVFPILLRK